MKRTLSIFSALALATVSGHAGVILQDSFSYPDGPLVGAAGSPWVVHSAGTQLVQVVSGQARLVGAGNSQDVNAPLAGGPYPPLPTGGPRLYACFQINVVGTPSGPGTYIAHFSDGTSFGFRARVWIHTNGAPAGTYRIGINNNSGTVHNDLPNNLPMNSVQTVVIRYDVGTGNSMLWLNPNLESDPGVMATDPISLLTITSFALRQGQDGGVVLLDNLRVGTSFIDIKPPCELGITCPPDITVTATTAAGAVVNYPPPSVFSTCPPVTVNCNPPSGSVFPIGVTAVTCTATDNRQGQATCTFKVTVRQAPAIEMDMFNYSLAQITLSRPGGGTEVVTLAGPTTVKVFFEGPVEGDANDDDGDGLDEVATQMTDMMLSGNSSMGPVVVMLDPTHGPALGEIEETANLTPGRLNVPPFAPGTAKSFFDVFFKIQVGGQTLFGQQPAHMEATITHKPPAPGETYINPFTQPIELVDSTGRPTGIRIIREIHIPNPPKEDDQFPYSLAKIVLRYPNGQTEQVVVAGPTHVRVCIPPNGMAADTDGDGVDQVPMEMVSLMLTGNSSQGPVTVMLDPNRPTTGTIEEVANNTPGVLDIPPFTPTGSARSSFDVAAKIQVGPNTFFPVVPLHLEAVITHKPPAPGESYMNLIGGIVPAGAANCEVPDNGSGTATLPPAGCEYLSPDSVHMIIDGLPPGTTIQIAAIHKNFLCPTGGVGVCSFPSPIPGVDCDDVGGSLGGEKECFNSTLQMQLTGTGALAAYNRALNIQVGCETHIGPRTPGQPVQSFDTDMFRLFGQIAGGGDPDFDLLRIVAGTDFGLPSPGKTTLTKLPNGNFAVDSFFDITYRIDFVGHPGGPFGGMSGSTTGTIRMRAGGGQGGTCPDGVELRDAAGNRTGICLIREMHTPNPRKERDFFSYSQGKINLRKPDGTIERVIVAGPTEVTVCIDDRDGLAADTDGDGLDQVPTEMTLLNLMGNSSMGPVMVTLDPNRPTLGQIEEKVNGTPGVLDLAPFGNQGCANSFFDVWAIIKVAGMTLCPTQALHIESMICHKPPLPGEAYMNLATQPLIPLVLCSNGQPTGISIVGEMHTPNPRKERDFFSYSQGKINLRKPNGAIERVIVAGPTEVLVCIDDADGLAADTDGDGLDEVPTQMTQLMLVGNSSMGPVTVMLDPTHPTLGQIEEKVNGTPGVLDLAPFGNNGCANSFFDVWVKIQVGGMSLCVTQALHIESMICHKPPLPGEAYMNLANQPPVQLLLCSNGAPTGITIVGEMHTPNPRKERDFFSYSQGKINLQIPGRPVERVIVAGPTEVLVCIDDNDGLAADTDGDGLDEVPTQMTQLNLMGNSSQGPVMISLDPNRPTVGQIEEKVNGTPGVLDLAPFGNQGCANSFFDVNVIIKVGGRLLCPEKPLHIEAMICHKPPRPGEAYMNLLNQAPVQLLDCATGQPTGIFLTGEMHTPNPRKERDFFSYSQGKINLRKPNGAIERVIVAGPTEVLVCIDDADGLAADTDGDGLDEVPTQMTQLMLVGNSSMGPVTVMLDPTHPTLGQIEEKVNGTPGVLDVAPFGNQGCGNSFFDVWVKIQVGGMSLCITQALHIESMICHKPPLPGEAYMNLANQPPVQLLLCSNGAPTGITIVGEMHTPNPRKERDFFSYSQGKINLRKPNGAIERVIVAGPTEVLVCIDDADGLAADTDGDGLDEVPTQMTQLMLVGNSSMGPVTVMLDPTHPTLGQIEEKVNGTPGVLDLAPFGNNGCANSFFDVWVKIQVGGMSLCITQALHIESMICHKPPLPGEAYMNLANQPPVQLLLCSNGAPTGITIVGEMHTPNPRKERDFFSYSQGKINLRKPNGAIERVIVAGPTEVLVCIDDADGLAADTDGDGLDEVPTQMTQLMLVGNSSMGPVTVMLDPNRPTLGQIEEKVNGTPGVLDLAPFGNNGCANSFFDVWVKIQVGGMSLCVTQALHIESMICHKPPLPGEAYMNLANQPPVQLLLCSNGAPTGITIVGEMHTPNPPKERDFFSYSQGKINLQIPGRPVERVIVAGPTEVLVCIDDNDGLAADTDGDGLDEVPTQMTQLNLMGNSSQGPVMISLDPNKPTLGQIEEKVNGTPGVLDLAPFGNQGCANSFFDVNVIIKVGGRLLCPEKPLHIEAMICHKPPRPGESYMNLLNQGPVQLLDCATGQPTGIFLTGEMHTPNPRKERDFFGQSQGKINLRKTDGTIERVLVSGPTEVLVCIDDTDGLAADTDADGLDEVPTEMTQLMLTGNSSMGPVTVMLDPTHPTVGQIEEKVNGTPGVLDLDPFGNKGCANSFFDVWVKIQVGGATLCVTQALHIEAMICHKPPLPGESYMNLATQPPIPLVLCSNGQPTGIFIVSEMHTPNPCTLAISCPSNFTYWTCNPNGTQASYLVTATSTCPGAVTITCTPPSGSTFPVGINNVTCTATDSGGNTATCSFTVTVIRDTLPPVLNCPTNDIVVKTCGSGEFVFYTTTSSDDCDTNVHEYCVPPSGSFFPAGTHVVTCYARDDCGNVSKCSFRVMVMPEPRPVLTITPLPGGQIRICWGTPCPGYVLQCARDLSPPILWETIATTTGTNCITLSRNALQRFYRLIRVEPKEILAQSDLLPPTGSYNNSANEMVAFANGLYARWFRNFIRPVPVPVPPPCLTCPDLTMTLNMHIDFQHAGPIADPAGPRPHPWSDAGADAEAIVRVHPTGAMGDTRFFDLELLQLLITGGTLPPGVMLRESPTRASLGRHIVRAVDGGHRIDSFFDVFVEVTVDGGQTWSPATWPIRMNLCPVPDPIPAANNNFPPIGDFDSPPGALVHYGNGVIARRFINRIRPGPVPLPDPIPPCLTCPPKVYDFPMQLEFEASMDGGMTYQMMSANVRTRVSARRVEEVGGMAWFDTELLSMDITGLPPGIMLRESPTRRSMGATSVSLNPQPLPPGQIGSFFDVFTELSIDGGANFVPGDEITVILRPAP